MGCIVVVVHEMKKVNSLISQKLQMEKIIKFVWENPYILEVKQIKK